MLETAITVRDNVDEAAIELVALGRWTRQVGVDLMAAVRRTLAQRPRAVLLDVSRVVGAEPTLAATIRLAEEQHAALRPPVPLMIVASEPQARRLRRSGAARRIPVHRTRAAALAELAGAPPLLQRARLHLQPSPLAAAEARNLIGDTCLAWNLVPLLHPARLIVSEFAANTIEHAGTPFTVTMTHRRADLLHLAVEDGHAQLPHLRRRLNDPDAPLAFRGNGLRLVAKAATAWGSAQTATGKVVWATLSTGDPDRAQP
ncbi:ATP-binding protein [Dactylosporangium vinaceum]|uniref:ATP-binding protein n=1 Tax=Dactylosporangium vinaceum TaxID=53362 RepID=A0ABV5MEE7_9ACTN|nr:ATP-binding protein [Dactylosporangium vinaceum]UAB92443.1 ATP-binding protein [Dactylosporangium vinaceum]